MKYEFYGKLTTEERHVVGGVKSVKSFCWSNGELCPSISELEKKNGFF